MAEKNENDLLSEIPEINTADKFRLTCKKLMITYKTHINKIEYLTWLNKKKTLRCGWVAHESGMNDPRNPYKHSHVLLEFEKAPDWTGASCLDFNGIHPNIKIVKTKKHWNNCILYMIKEDKSITELNEMAEKLGGIADWVWKSTDLSDALRKCESVQEAVGIKLLYDNKPIEKHKTDYVPRLPWQSTLLNDLNRIPDPRKIIWYHDSIGNTEKSMMAAYLEDHQDALVFRQFGGARDVATIMQMALKSGWNGNKIIVDLPRNAEDKSIYEPIEGIKDGRMTAIKYQGGFLTWARPHVVVFANFWPKFSCMSKDRWVRRDITPKNHPVGASSKSLDALEFGIESDDDYAELDGIMDVY